MGALLTVPYIMSMLWTGNTLQITKKENTPADNSRFMVRLEDETGSLSMTVEEYLLGYLPLVIPAEYEMECLRAQAILLRTEVLAKLQRQKEEGRESFTLPKTEYLSNRQLQGMWGRHFTENMEKIRQAVSSTGGIYLTYEGLPIQACFFAVSPGSTRNPEETLGEGYGYLKETACPKDYLSQDYLTVISCKSEKLEKLFGGDDFEFTYDSSGYVKTTAVFQKNQLQREIPGEVFRGMLELPSACFTVEKDKNNYIFQVKGVGHGFGMSQFGANELAREGADYRTILNNFFQNITFDKCE